MRNVAEKSDPSPSQRNPQSSSIKLLKQIIHRLVKETERDREGLIFRVTLQSAHIWQIKQVINSCKLLQIVTQSPFKLNIFFNTFIFVSIY